MIKKFFNKKSSLEKIFYPNSIAVIGASNDTDKIGGYIFSQIIKNKEIKPYPINVKWSTIQNKKAYINVTEIKEEVDLAIIAIPGKFVIESLNDCIKAGIKNIIIISAGFKEIGEAGKIREEEIKYLIEKHDLNVIGPNCLGILNPQIKLNCSFAKDIPASGDIALISQSGAVIDAIIDWSFKHNVGFSKIVSLGNMAGVDEFEILKYLKDDPNTKSIVFYMETLENGIEFGPLLKEISKQKPVIIIKPGTSDNAKKAIGSHTGSLAQDNILVETLIKDNNGILVESLNELFNILIALKSNFPKNNNLVILTNAGGPGVISTDVAAKTGFEIYKLSDNEKKRLNFLPKEASLNNPIDILGDAKSDRYAKTLTELARISEIGNIMILLTPQIMTDSETIAKYIQHISKNTDKNVFSCFIGDKEVKNAVEFLDKNNFSNFLTPTDALVAMKKLYDYNNFDYKLQIPKYNFNQEEIEKIRKKLSKEDGLLDYELTKRIITKVLAIRMPEKIIFSNIDDILSNNLEPNKKYVLKVDGKNFIHKKELGGVVKNITSVNFEEIAIDLYERILKQTHDFNLTLEEEIEGHEAIIGLKQDSDLGNFIMFGMGGTYVNIFKDIHFATCPLNKKKAQNLVEQSKVYEMLKGYRGSKPVDLNALFEILTRMSFLQEIFPEIKEIDLNPIICNEKGIHLVDVKFIV